MMEEMKAQDDILENEEALEDDEQPEENDVDSEIKEMKDQLLRSLAEAENVRRRAAREKEDALKYAITQFARDLLPVSDNLRRAIESMPEESREGLSKEVLSFIDGVVMTEKELLTAFEKHGIEKIHETGVEFDHEQHQAMFEIETNEHAPGTIVEMMQAGYKLKDRLLRPAMVGVAKAQANPES